ncbi:MAG TPA: nucleotidyltransferase [Desulfobulbaceae bacterium]|nr:nucleotidyltransferase [Desulfobulbaceae bacterium]
MSNIVTREEALQKAAQKLDISPSKYQQAMERFKTMRSYLLEGEYEGATAQSEIYLQGSFKLGTEIRPYKDSKDADYDIDIVCRLEHQKEIIAPKTVKHQVGDHLKAHGTYEKMLDDEGKRCWTLNYAEQDGVGFHMDILPSVQESWNTFREYYRYHSAIAVTNKCSDTGTYNWTPSNPKDFAEWFYDKNKTAFEDVKQAQKQVLFENYRQDGLFSDRDAVPNIHVKTPLQRAIQLLKRHRDIRFCNQQNEKCKPISMVITVLSAQIYRNESTIYETLRNLIDTLSRHADQMQPTFRFDEAMAQSAYTLITRTADGKWNIPNPTNHGENFADKWHEEENGVPHARAKAFFQWVVWAKEDFINIAERLDEEHYTRSLVSPVNNSNSLVVAQSRALSFNVPHRQKPESQWPVQIYYQASISASYNKNGWRLFSDGSSNFELCSGDPVETGKRICFKAKTNVSRPFQVFWQVVNTGDEATNAGCLRGGFYNSSGDCSFELGTKTRIEPTRYRGYHWVECFIIKKGVCVARSGEFIVRIV